MLYLAVSTEYRRVTDGLTDGQTERQSSCHGIVRAMHRPTRCAVKIQKPHIIYSTTNRILALRLSYNYLKPKGCL